MGWQPIVLWDGFDCERSEKIDISYHTFGHYKRIGNWTLHYATCNNQFVTQMKPKPMECRFQ